MRARILILTPLLLAPIFGGLACTRPRPGTLPAEAGTSVSLSSTPGAAAGLAAPGLQVEQPAAGASLGSPLQVQGRMLNSGARVSAQVLSPSADGRLTWRGNARLAVDEAGGFSGVVTYTLGTAGPGVVEVLAVDPATAMVLERRQVEVQLAAAP